MVTNKLNLLKDVHHLVTLFQLNLMNIMDTQIMTIPIPKDGLMEYGVVIQISLMKPHVHSNAMPIQWNIVHITFGVMVIVSWVITITEDIKLLVVMTVTIQNIWSVKT